MLFKLRGHAFILVALMSLSTITHAAEEVKEEATQKESLPNWKEENLTGEWGGTRTELYQKGIDVGFTHKSDILSNVSGGIKRGTEWEGHTEARLTLDLEKLMGLNATTIFALYHSDLGAKFNRDYVGGLGVDNIEVAKNTGQFYQAWIQKNFLNDNVSILAGIYAIDTEFYVTETSALFLGPPYGMANEFAQAGKNGPPAFPFGTPALRIKLRTPDKKFYLMGALTNGLAGNPNNHDGTQIKIDGSLKVVEFGWTPQVAEPDAETKKETATQEPQEEAEVFSKTAIGFWRFSARKDDISELDGNGNLLRRSDQGAYFLTEHNLYTEPGQPSQGLSGFFRVGFASEDINQVDWTSSAGLRYHGLISGRDDDIAGVAVTVNHASSKYKIANTSESHETNVEFTYQAKIRPWLALQPSVQYIVNPSMDSALKNAWILGLRTEFEF